MFKNFAAVLLLLCSSCLAQVGPVPGGGASPITTWNVVQSYSAGQAVIRNGVIYVSLSSSNVANDPAGSPSQWSTNFSSSFTLPTASAAGQVLTSTGPGTTYTAQSLTGATVAALPGSPSFVYNFIQAGDQSGTTIHDATGNGNNATISAAQNVVWTGTGVNFANYNGTAIQAALPAVAGNDRSFCFTMYEPPVQNLSTVYKSALLANAGGNTLYNYINDFGAGYGYQAYSMFIGTTEFSTVTNPPHSGFHTECAVLGLTSSSTSDAYYSDGNLLNSSVASGGHAGDTWAGATNLAPVNGSEPSANTFYYIAGWPTQLTAAQVMQASNAMQSAVAAKGVPTTPVKVASGKPTIIAVGDSITNGGGASTTTWWPADLSVNAAYTLINNEGLSGYAAWALAAFAPWKDVPQCLTGAAPSAAVFFAGTNDIFVFGFSAAATYNNIMSWVNQMQGSGCQLFVGTMLPRASSTGDTDKNTLNPLIRSGAQLGLYNLIDFASNPNLGADGAYSNATYFNADLTHPTNAGQSLLGAEASNAINAYGIGAASEANPTAYSGTTTTMVSADRYAVNTSASATAWTLPDCLGVTGTVYQIFNNAAGTITFSGKASEAITGTATAAQNATARFQATLISQAAAGCGWQRIQ